MKIRQIIIDEISLRLKAPIIALEKMTAREYLPRIFMEAALSELYSIKKLLEKKQGRISKKGRS
jgi:hypothetical protein